MYWQGHVELERGVDGRRRRRVIRSRDREIAELKLRDAIREERSKIRKPRLPVLPPSPVTPPSGSTSEWLQYWMNGIAALEVRPKTAAGYRSALKQHILPQVGDVLLVDLTAAHIRAMNAAIIESGRQTATALLAYRILSTALQAAYREGYVLRNVAAQVRPPRVARPVLAHLSLDHMRTVIAGTEHDRLGSRWAAALLTGARQGELLGLELDRVSPDFIELSWQLQRLTWSHGCRVFCGWARGGDCPDRTVEAPADHERRHLHGGLWLTRPKSRAGWRVLPLVEPLRTAIASRVEQASREHNPNGLLWTTATFERHGQTIAGRPIDPRSDNTAWHRVLESSRVPQARLHDARHAVVDLLYETGASEIVIQDIVGHATVDMSRRYRSQRAATPMTAALNDLSSYISP